MSIFALQLFSIVVVAIETDRIEKKKQNHSYILLLVSREVYKLSIYRMELYNYKDSTLLSLVLCMIIVSTSVGREVENNAEFKCLQCDRGKKYEGCYVNA